MTQIERGSWSPSIKGYYSKNGKDRVILMVPIGNLDAPDEHHNVLARMRQARWRVVDRVWPDNPDTENSGSLEECLQVFIDNKVQPGNTFDPEPESWSGMDVFGCTYMIHSRITLDAVCIDLEDEVFEALATVAKELGQDWRPRAKEGR